MWQQIISDLVSVGFTEARIAALTGYSQPAVHRLKTGKMKEPGYSHGAALLDLHRARFNETEPRPRV